MLDGFGEVDDERDQLLLQRDGRGQLGPAGQNRRPAAGRGSHPALSRRGGGRGHRDRNGIMVRNLRRNLDD